MRLNSFLVPAIAFGVLLGSASAQSGTLDQVSPFPSGGGGASFNADATSLTWQCQVKAGIPGQLEGVTFSAAQGNAGATFDVRLRAGAGWNVGPALFSGTVTKGLTGVEDIFVDMTSAGLTLNANDLFVIEIQGTGSGVWLGGSYVPPPGAPLYSEPLFLGGPGCFTDCGWRIAFQTWMVGGFSSFCFGDGTQATPCPCSNSGLAGRGCNNSAATGGAQLSVSGSTAPDSIGLHTIGELPSALTIFLQGNAQISAVPFGDGLRCAGGLLKRLYVKSAVGGAANAPLAGDPSVSAQSASLGDPIASGTSRWYQAYYRDANQSFCPAPTGNTYNISNAVRINW
ncbi:MAG: hypothetical protein IPJ19_09270 [Planctomycetes bacterium]|nr:hypothetical protein [Planctomycetota bacterium]